MSLSQDSSSRPYLHKYSHSSSKVLFIWPLKKLKQLLLSAVWTRTVFPAVQSKEDTSGLVWLYFFQNRKVSYTILLGLNCIQSSLFILFYRTPVWIWAIFWYLNIPFLANCFIFRVLWFGWKCFLLTQKETPIALWTLLVRTKIT